MNRLLKTFLELVRIDSISFEERAVGDYILGLLNVLGVACAEDRTANALNGNCGNIIARLPGNVNGPSILLAAHMDTVEPGRSISPVVRKGVVYSRGQTVLGADDKAGVAIILEVLRTVVEEKIDHPAVTVVFTVAEEKGLKGAGRLDFKKIKADLGFVLDEGGPVGAITVRAPYQDYFACEFAGKAAHAGVEPEQGRSAVAAAAKAISRMKLGRLDKETTANIGLIKGGTAINVVPAGTVIEGEARSHSLVKLKRQIDRMKQACDTAAKEAAIKHKITVTRLYDGYDLPSDHTAVVRAKAAVKAAGKRPRMSMSGGGSDTNVFNKYGIPSVNLGIGYERVHTIDERMPLDALDAAFQISMALVARTDRGQS